MKIYRYVKKNSINKQYTTGQTKYYNDTVRTAIIKEFSTKKPVRPVEHFEQHNVDVDILSLLKQQVNKQSEELKIKNKQLENKDTQISQMQNLLDQQQRLALQDKKLLEEYKSEINDLKALKIPSQDSTEEETGKQSQEADSNLKFGNKVLEGQISEQAKIEQKEGSRKWYQFWKR